MSGVSNAFDDLLGRIAAILPNHARLPDAYNLEQNNFRFLDQGVTLAIGPGENSQRQISCRLSTRRTFDVKIVRKFYSLENDTAGRDSAAKAVMEDLYLLALDFESTPTLPSGANIVQWVSDSGIQNLLGSEKEYFLTTTGTVLVEYFDAY